MQGGICEGQDLLDRAGFRCPAGRVQGVHGVILLVDSHTLLWFLKDDPLLSAVAKAHIEDPANKKLVSVASCWEIAIKAGLSKMKLGEPAAVLLGREIPRNNFVLLE